MGFNPYYGYGMPTVVEGDFEWDSDKATSNLAKHGVSFAEAATVFADPLRGLSRRWIWRGSHGGDRCIAARPAAVRGARRAREHDRIISARPATVPERDVYETGGDP